MTKIFVTVSREMFDMIDFIMEPHSSKKQNMGNTGTEYSNFWMAETSNFFYNAIQRKQRSFT
jgi:hypothetical protein